MTLDGRMDMQSVKSARPILLVDHNARIQPLHRGIMKGVKQKHTHAHKYLLLVSIK